MLRGNGKRETSLALPQIAFGSIEIRLIGGELTKTLDVAIDVGGHRVAGLFAAGYFERSAWLATDRFHEVAMCVSECTGSEEKGKSGRHGEM